jgi:predicted nucleotide-binding protein (sugar kinase/HSP70/actin superfamily)
MVPPTNRDILAAGAKMVADVTCLPVKVYAGHVAWLRDQGNVESVFVPAIRSVERGALHCSKFQALPDLMRATVPDCPPLLEIGIDVHRYKISQDEAFRPVTNSLQSLAPGVPETRPKWKKPFRSGGRETNYLDALARMYGN